MLNATVRAAAEGLSSALFDRRRMLLGLAAASTAAATGTATAETYAAENPELIRLSKELPALADKYHVARKHQDDVEAKWSPLWPIAPDEITQPGDGSLYGNPRERGFRGEALRRNGEEHPRRLIPADSFKYQVDRAQRALKNKKLLTLGTFEDRTRTQWEAELAEDKRCLEMAEAYEAETKRIGEQSNYTASWEAHAAAAATLESHVSRIMAEPDHTMEGLIIKAEALDTWDGVVTLYRLSIKGRDWHGQIAVSILRHAKTSA